MVLDGIENQTGKQVWGRNKEFHMDMLSFTGLGSHGAERPGLNTEIQS